MASILDGMNASLLDFRNVIGCLCRNQPGFYYESCHDTAHGLYEAFVHDISVCQSCIGSLRDILASHFCQRTKIMPDESGMRKIFDTLHKTIVQMKNNMSRFRKSEYDTQNNMYIQSVEIIRGLLEFEMQIKDHMVPTPETQIKSLRTLYAEIKIANQQLVIDKFKFQKMYDESTEAAAKLQACMKDMQIVNNQLVVANKVLTQQNIECHGRLTTIEDSNMILRKKSQDNNVQLQQLEKNASENEQKLHFHEHQAEKKKTDERIKRRFVVEDIASSDTVMNDD